VSSKGNRSEALNIMVSKKFRHLPVLSEVQQQQQESENAASLNVEGEDEDRETLVQPPPASTVVGLLDITKCVFDRLDELNAKVSEDDRILSAVELLEQRGNVDLSRVLGSLSASVQGCPTVGSLLKEKTETVEGEAIFKGYDVPQVPLKASVREAASVMKEQHSTAVLVMTSGDSGSSDRVSGILTTKDIVLRVLAAQLDPSTTSSVRVMVSHLLVPLTISIRLMYIQDTPS
jgi:CBS domain-containing protein